MQGNSLIPRYRVDPSPVILHSQQPHEPPHEAPRHPAHIKALDLVALSTSSLLCSFISKRSLTKCHLLNEPFPATYSCIHVPCLQILYVRFTYHHLRILLFKLFIVCLPQLVSALWEPRILSILLSPVSLAV